MTQSIAQIQLANNANVQVHNENISTITAKTRDLRSTLAAAQQQITSLLEGQRVAVPPTPATVYAPEPLPVYAPAPYAVPPPAAYAMTAVPAYVPAPPAAEQAYTPAQLTLYQWQGQRRRGRNRGGCGRGLKRSMMFALHPPAAPYNLGGVPPPAQDAQEYVPNPYKRFNNWNMCFSCGFDIPHSHISATCPFKEEIGHQVGCTRENSEAYKMAGYFVRQK